MLGDTGNKRAIRILLECILVTRCKWNQYNCFLTEHVKLALKTSRIHPIQNESGNLLPERELYLFLRENNENKSA